MSWTWNARPSPQFLTLPFNQLETELRSILISLPFIVDRKRVRNSGWEVRDCPWGTPCSGNQGYIAFPAACFLYLSPSQLANQLLAVSVRMLGFPPLSSQQGPNISIPQRLWFIDKHQHHINDSFFFLRDANDTTMFLNHWCIVHKNINVLNDVWWTINRW